jgi:hypothetical protein
MNTRNLEGANKDTRAELRVGTRTCQCSGCGLFFTGVWPFDRHLVTDEEGGEPLCQTPEEMQQIGMVANKYGVWQYGQSKKLLEAA